MQDIQTEVLMIFIHLYFAVMDKGQNHWNKKENGKSGYSNYWANKGYSKESQIETNEETAEKFINGQNHQLFHVQAGAGEYAGFNRDLIVPESTYKKHVLAAFNELGVCREEELVVNRECKLNNYHAHAFVAFRLKRDGKRSVDRERAIRILSKQLGRDDCDGCQQMRARGKTNNCPDKCGWGLFIRVIKDADHLRNTIRFIKRIKDEWAVECGGEREEISCQFAEESNHNEYQCDDCFEIRLRRREEEADRVNSRRDEIGVEGESDGGRSDTSPAGEIEMNTSPENVVYWCINRFNPSKRIYFFSDPPHLMETIRIT